MPQPVLDQPPPGPQVLDQLAPVRRADHAVLDAVHDQNPLPPHRVRHGGELRGRLPVPPRCYGLEEEAEPREAVGIALRVSEDSRQFSKCRSS